MEKREILPPDELDIETEVENIIENGDRKVIARWSKIKYGRLCAMIRPDDPATNPIYETAAFLYGVVKTDRNKARKIFNILYRLAFQWGLVDEEPVDVLQLATQRLMNISEQDIRGMSTEERLSVIALAASLENEAGKVKDEAIRIRNREQFGKAHEIGAR